VRRARLLCCLVSATRRQQRLGETPPAPGLLEDVAVAECLRRGSPQVRIGATVEACPLSLGSSEPGARLRTDLATGRARVVHCRASPVEKRLSGDPRAGFGVCVPRDPRPLRGVGVCGQP
jgi:hypothetical protein